MALIVLSLSSVVLAFGYDLGHGSHYVTRAIVVLVLVLGMRVYRAYTE